MRFLFKELEKGLHHYQFDDGDTEPERIVESQTPAASDPERLLRIVRRG